jgi:uncharacterized protein YdhG (YjbR/CyaY superfamily)
MKARAKELKAASNGAEEDPEAAVLAKIAEMPDHERTLAEQVHELIKAAAPDLTARLWYGMPAYAKNGKDICFFQVAEKFDSRYSTLGFNPPANLDNGPMWPTAYAIVELTPEVENQITTLVKQAVS